MIITIDWGDCSFSKRIMGKIKVKVKVIGIVMVTATTMIVVMIDSSRIKMINMLVVIVLL